MSLPQFVFFCGLAAVAVSIIAFGVVVLLGAKADDGGPFLARLGRPGHERAELQRWAFYLHRISGVGLFAFLCLHVADVGLYGISRDLYNEVHQVYGSAPMRVGEVVLLFGLLFHAFNGVRLIVLDIADCGLTAATRALYVVIGATVLAGCAGSVFIMGPVIR